MPFIVLSTLAVLASLLMANGSAPPPRSINQGQASPLTDWVGTWEGEMTTVSADRVTEPIPVVLRVSHMEDGSFEWRTVYNRDSIGGLRDYRLLPDSDDLTRYVLDEQNGIRLVARLLGNSLVTPFEVGGQVLISRYSLIDEATLEHEILFWKDEAILVTTGVGPAGEQGHSVTSFELAGIQRSRLRRVTR